MSLVLLPFNFFFLISCEVDSFQIWVFRLTLTTLFENIEMTPSDKHSGLILWEGDMLNVNLGQPKLEIAWKMYIMHLTQCYFSDTLEIETELYITLFYSRVSVNWHYNIYYLGSACFTDLCKHFVTWMKPENYIIW